MKRGTVIGVVIAAVLIAGIGGAAIVSLADRGDDAAGPTTASTPDRIPTPTPSSSGSPTAAVTPAAGSPEATPGEYVDYSDAALTAATGTPVLFFHAPWCPQCRSLDADIVASGVPDGLTILKVDYDSNQALRQRYGVTLQTTVVAIDDSGEATAIFVPYDEPTLDSALAGLGLTG